MAVVSVFHKDGVYECVKIFYYEHNFEAEKTFASGDFVKDWFHATRHYITHVQVVDEDESNKVISCLHSVDQFIFDLPERKYKRVYLTLRDGEPQLHYPDTDNYFVEKRKIGECWDVFVPINTVWNFSQYKEYCTKEKETV